MLDSEILKTKIHYLVWFIGKALFMDLFRSADNKSEFVASQKCFVYRVCYACLFAEVTAS